MRIFVDREPEVHHGDCLGGDAEFHAICLDLEFEIHIHPPLIPKNRAFCHPADFTYTPKAYLSRNHDIVDACDILIAAPAKPETRRSGTWATIRYARKQKKPIALITKSGAVEFSNLIF